MVSKPSNSTPLSKSDIADLRRKGQESLYFFAKGILGFDRLVPEVHRQVCDELQDYRNHSQTKVTLPRGWYKTTICSCAYPLWRAIEDLPKSANVRVLVAQNTYKNACKKLAKISALVKGNALFRALYPEVLPDNKCRWSQDALCLNRPGAYDEATFEAAGTGTQVTSRHYNLIIEDDTVAPEIDDLGIENVAPGPEEIAKAIGWHRLTLPLLDDISTSQNLVVGTRWAELDLLSWIEDNEDYHSLTRAALEDESGQPDYNGKVVWSRFDRDTLKKLEKALGGYMFFSLYLNSPLKSADQSFKPEWWRTYLTEPQGLICYITIDLAGDPATLKGDKPDYNVVMTCGKDMDSGNVYVLDYFRKRCSPGEVIDALFRQVGMWHPVKVGLEAVAYQGSLEYFIKERMKKQSLWFSVEGITHGKRSKFQRILGLQPMMEAGTLFFREWMRDLRTELMAYPRGANDDLPDTLSMQLRFWAMTRSKKELRERDMVNDPLSLTKALSDIGGLYQQKKGFPHDLMVGGLKG